MVDNEKNMVGESAGALLYLLRSAPLRTGLYMGALPFAVLWIFRDSVATAFAFQMYLLTAGVFVYEPFRNQLERVKQRDFWKAMMQAGLFIHPVFAAGIWYLDVTYSSFVVGGATLFLLIFSCSVLETIVLKSLVNRFLERE